MAESINRELSGEALLARYRTALAFQPDRLRALVRNISVAPHWFGTGDAFWYRRDTAAGHEFVQVDPDTRTSRPAFDHIRLAGLLDGVTGRTHDPAALPFDRFEYGGDDSGNQAIVRVELEGTTWEVDLAAGSVARSATPLPPLFPGFSPHGDIPGRNWGPVLPSPDGRREVFVREHDLYLRERASGEERRLTHDGAERHGYGQLSGTIWSGEVGMRRDGVPWPVQAIWSPDSRYVATLRIDNRAVGLMHLLDSVNDGRYEQRPTLLPYTMVQAGDAAIPMATFLLFEAESGRRIDVDLDPIPAMEAPIANGLVTWSDDSRSLYIRWIHRLCRALSIRRVDATTGAVNVVLDEASDRPVEDRGWGAEVFKGLTDRDEALWISNRDGWRHLYRLDTRTGQLLGQITSGDWAVDRILHVDAGREWLSFTARGREPGHDPYYLHAYRCHLDGSGLTLLTPEDADHHLIVSPSGRYLLDRYSRVDLPTVSVLRDSSGELVMELERADISALQATGWQPPERFQGVADDGETPLYGVVYRPPDLDPADSYPVIDWAREYGDAIVAPRSFSQGLYGFAGAVATAALGFITVNLDGRGTPGRSRAFHNASSIYLDASGLADHVAMIRQLAERYPYIDAERVGITGYSGGGYTAARAILLFPDFYRVAVSGAGNHDQRLICGVESEAQIGFPDEHPDAWARQANTSLVANLRGKLLLIHGELDDDVPPAASLQLADALLQAGKEFDFLIVPRLNHTRLFWSLIYRRKLWDYFVRHLHGVEPPDWNTISFEGLGARG